MRLGAYAVRALGRLAGAEALRQEARSPSATAIATSSTTSSATLLEQKGLVLSGLSPDGGLVEIIELADHPWFLASQFHPEFKSRPLDCHPIFRGFVRAALIHKAESKEAPLLKELRVVK